MKHEERLLITLLKVRLGIEEEDKVNKLLRSNSTDWGYFFNLVIHHKLPSFLYHQIIDSKLPVSRKWISLLEINYLGTKQKNQERESFLTPIIQDLYSKNIICTPIKGAALNLLVYGDLGLRQSNDYDLLIQEKDIPKVTKVIEDYGFIQSNKIENGVPLPATRFEKTFYRLSTHEVVPFLKKGDLFNNFFEIDVQFDIFSHAENLPVDFPLENLFNNLETINNDKGKFFILKPEHNLLQLCSHIFQDNTMLQNIIKGKDHILRDFVDIYELINKYTIDWDNFSNEVKSDPWVKKLFTMYYFTQRKYLEILFLRTL